MQPVHIAAARQMHYKRRMHVLTEAQAELFARLALAGIQREYPNHIVHLLNGPQDVQSPRALHPAFYGSYDWHSAVHGHWLLVRVLRCYPGLAAGERIRAALRENLTAEALMREAQYFQAPGRRAFERPYGWGWLLALAAELHTWEDRDARAWSAHLAPLADTIVRLWMEFLPKQTYPVRTGTHNNTAFALVLALAYAEATGHAGLKAAVASAARHYYLEDRDYPALLEPGGEDFLSASLTEAMLMAQVLAQEEFLPWLEGFLPGLGRCEPKSLLVPAEVSDRSDPKIVHLDGLNLSRAWCMRRLAAALNAHGNSTHAAHSVLAACAERHASAGLAHVASGDYVGEHWLATFAVLMLSERGGL